MGSDPIPNPRRYAFRPADASRRIEPYHVDHTTLVGPPLPGHVMVASTVDELIDTLAADLVVHAENCVRQFGDFHLALSGGSTPQPLYERLMYDPNYRRLPWRRTHLWQVDERCVPLDDPQSNFRMISEIIVDHADIPREQVHPMPAMSPTADVDYENELRESLAWREKGQDRLDYVLLGMGADGHTASLFPGSDALKDTVRLVRFNVSPQAPPHERITMTFAMINAARFISILVTGASKTQVIKRVAGERESVDELPVMGVTPLNGELRWYLDAAACGLEVPEE